MRYESTKLGQLLATLAKNDELELPNAGNYSARDYAIAVDAYLDWLKSHALFALENSEPGEMRSMAKYLYRHCAECDILALPDDNYCTYHRAVATDNNLPF